MSNRIYIESPGLNPDHPHTVVRAFSDIELLEIKKHLEALNVMAPETDEAAVAIRRLIKLLRLWQETSP